jgi:hypothetical protein
MSSIIRASNAVVDTGADLETEGFERAANFVFQHDAAQLQSLAISWQQPELLVFS